MGPPGIQSVRPGAEFYQPTAGRRCEEQLRLEPKILRHQPDHGVDTGGGAEGGGVHHGEDLAGEEERECLELLESKSRVQSILMF